MRNRLFIGVCCIALIVAGSITLKAQSIGLGQSDFSLYALKTQVVPAITPVCSNTAIPGGNTVGGTAAEIAFTTVCILPPMTVAGQTVFCEAKGVFTLPTLVPNLRGKVKVNGVSLLDTTDIPGLVMGTNLGWRAYFSFLVLSPGVTGSVDAQGVLYAQIGTTQELPIPVKNATSFTVDTTNMTLSLTAQWSNAGANSIQLRQLACK